MVEGRFHRELRDQRAPLVRNVTHGGYGVLNGGDWQDSFRELLTAAHTAGTAAGTTSLAEPAWAGFRTLCVTDVLPETATVSSIHLVARTGARSHPPGPDGT